MSIMTSMNIQQPSDHQGWSAARPSIWRSKPCGFRVVGAPGMHMPFLTNRANTQTWLLSLSGGRSG